MHSLQYITDNTGKKVSVVLPIKEYKKIVEDLEDLEDIRLYDNAKKVKGKGISLEEYRKKRNAKKNG